MTEQEFENRLLALIEGRQKYVLADIRRTNECSREPVVTDAYISGNSVIITLKDSGSLEEWSAALAKAEQLVASLEKKREWEFSNPIFNERLNTKLRYIYS